MEQMIFIFLLYFQVNGIDVSNIHASEIKLASSYEKGQKLFKVNCASCHGFNGTNNAMCPPNRNSSLELLKLKVKEGKYPNGYKPKRTSKAMPKFKNLSDDDIESIYLFLQDSKKSK